MKQAVVITALTMFLFNPERASPTGNSMKRFVCFGDLFANVVCWTLFVYPLHSYSYLFIYVLHKQECLQEKYEFIH